RGASMPWYDGPTLLEHLESVELAGDRNLDDRRFPVQWVIRPMSEEHHDYRGYAGQVAGGVWRAGDDVLVLPSGRRSRVAAVEPVDEALPGMSVTIRLEDDLDVGRGDMLADPQRAPAGARELEATVCWVSERPREPRAPAGGLGPAVPAYWVALSLRGVGVPLFVTWLNRNIDDSSVRATVLSISEQADAVGQWTRGPAIGGVGSLVSLRAALLVGAAALSPAVALYGRALRHGGDEPELEALPLPSEP